MPRATGHAAKTLMIQGSSSSAGKSLMVTALCRVFNRRGLRVAPFKAQNMSNNSAVCLDGGEIGRAQAVQALAAGIEPDVHMNPVLLKPEADTRSQVIVNGRVWKTLPASEYYRHHRTIWKAITTSLTKLRMKYDLVIIEGAGSPAELNLKSNDMANMAVALHAKSPVLLVGDIDRGGIFAQLLGTLWLLPPVERQLVKGLLVNKFRGEAELFRSGVQILEEQSGLPVLGVIPYIHQLGIAEEDAVALDEEQNQSLSSSVQIDVIHLPHISNFDDFDPLAAEAGLQVRYIRSPAELGQAHAIIIPGTKSTVADLNWMRETGLVDKIIAHAHTGKAVIGICGGYQMLGQVIRDKRGIESRAEVTPGLDLLPCETVFQPEKTTQQIEGKIQIHSNQGNPENWLAELDGQVLTGYEIHMGHTTSQSTWLNIYQRNGSPASVMDGAVRKDGRIWGCTMHGLFANDNFRRTWLRSLGWSGQKDSPVANTNDSIDRLANVVESALDIAQLEKIVWES